MPTRTDKNEEETRVCRDTKGDMISSEHTLHSVHRDVRTTLEELLTSHWLGQNVGWLTLSGNVLDIDDTRRTEVSHKEESKSCVLDSSDR